MFPIVQLSFVHENLVAIAFLKQTLSGRLVHIEQSPIYIIASRFESGHNFPQMLILPHVLFDSYNHVQVVWHNAQFPHLHQRVRLIYLLLLFLNNRISKGRELHIRHRLALQTSPQRAQYRHAFPHHKGQHICSLAAIVMPWGAPLHRVLYLVHLHACSYGFFPIHASSSIATTIPHPAPHSRMILVFVIYCIFSGFCSNVTIYKDSAKFRLSKEKAKNFSFKGQKETED